jgi:hypothetical protein
MFKCDYVSVLCKIKFNSSKNNIQFRLKIKQTWSFLKSLHLNCKLVDDLSFDIFKINGNRLLFLNTKWLFILWCRWELVTFPTRKYHFDNFFWKFEFSNFVSVGGSYRKKFWKNGIHIINITSIFEKQYFYRLNGNLLN